MRLNGLLATGVALVLAASALAPAVLARAGEAGPGLGGSIDGVIAHAALDLCMGPETGTAAIEAIDRRAVADGWPAMQARPLELGVKFDEHRVTFTEVGDKLVSLAGLRMDLTNSGRTPITWVQCNVGSEKGGDAKAIADLMINVLGPTARNPGAPDAAFWAWSVKDGVRTPIDADGMHVPNKVAAVAQSLAPGETIMTASVEVHEGHLMAAVNTYVSKKR